MKLLMRDTIIVYLSVVSGSFIIEQFMNNTIMKEL